VPRFLTAVVLKAHYLLTLVPAQPGIGSFPSPLDKSETPRITPSPLRHAPLGCRGCLRTRRGSMGRSRGDDDDLESVRTRFLASAEADVLGPV
jgi:hypothetical protein